ncbi:MAG: peptidoglycan DD-metalloendopeptidase family protein [Oscillospiraceae bacterium]|nr:peptidoglycan DD-metalloendopeptidase family protein [Oscillospiraceae bacterium]
MDKSHTPTQKTEYSDPHYHGKREASPAEAHKAKKAEHSSHPHAHPSRKAPETAEKVSFRTIPVKELPRRFKDELKLELRNFRRAMAYFLVGVSEDARSGIAHFRETLRDKRNHGFPESTHFLLQLILFLWGMLPFLFFRFSELLHRRRRKTLHRASRRQQLAEAIHMHPMGFLGGATAVLAIVMFCTIYTFGTVVNFRGEELGAVHNSDDAETAIRAIEMAAQDTFHGSYNLNRDDIACTSTLVLRTDLLGAEDMENLLAERIGLITKGYGLYINDELICATEYEYVLDDLLQQLKYAYTTEYTVSCDFEETVEVRSGYVPTSKLMSVGKIAETLNSTHEEEVTYTVKSGDVWSRIASKNDMTSTELLKLNPGYNMNNLHAGDTLILSAAVPYLTITFTEQQHYLSDVPYDVEYKEDKTMYKGDTKVLSPGVYGKADVLADVTYKNGEEIDRVIRSYTTLTDPVTEIQAAGTKPRPTWHPTGSFRWPCSGNITSGYGGRNLWGRYNYHGGIDIANRAGTPIYAADGGTVTHAGWMGTYGYLVIIDHGNGFETYYGHNSKLLVSKGDKVHKGEQIAKMGRTGNTSGNHCHFEVRWHGERRNPMNYL